MKWINHTAIAIAFTIPFNVAALPFSVLGSTAPDWLEWVLKAFGLKVKHRGITHYLSNILIGIALAIALHPISSFFLWFMLGYLSHWVADSLTITGVPLSPLSKTNTTLFGGKIRTGEPKEYLLAFGILAASLLLFSPNFSFHGLLNFNPYLMNYPELWGLNIIDNKEMRELRWKFF